ncbi:MAG: NADH-quinone oxidoreductase subunit L [Micromonosporaceae bacterium]|nr:NADH-quinone oxidoreductase subunit L [Micromonosporaceae bacterium]
MTTTLLAASLPLVPLAAALAGLVLPLRSRRAAAILGVGSTGFTLLAAVLLALSGPAAGQFTLVSFIDVDITVGVRVDAIAALVAIAVGAVATAVQVYSVTYLHDDERYGPYAAQVSLFTAAMFTVVVASDLVQLLVGWEVMGICSYLLIGHDRRLPEAPAAAVKAFLVTRVGDVGFWIGVVLLGLAVGSFRIDDVLAAASGGEIGAVTLTAACLLLLAGVAGKSAQFPLHTWLPDAMAGPTPISALIHAATMVAAGVYVVGRLLPLYLASPVALAALAISAAITMLLGALAATAQDDIKRVLAWSTVSQIGYMAAALAVGSAAASTFHLLSHAAFKALLFLAAGAVIHAVGSNLMSRMGGSWRAGPVTFWTMTAGLAALVGLPPFAGFWSKESVLGAAWEAAAHGERVTSESGLPGAGGWFGPVPAGAPTPSWAAWLVLLSGLVTVLVTGWYATRLWLRTFFGDRRGEFSPHDPAPLMSWPLLALAVPSVVLGLVVALWPAGDAVTDGGGRFAYAPLAEAPSWVAFLPRFDPGLTVVVLALTVLGAAGAWVAWRRDTAADPARALGPARTTFARAFFLDEVQDFLVVRPARALARATRRADEQLIDGAVEGTGAGALRLGRLVAAAHRVGLPGYATAALLGAVLLGVAAVVTGVWA